MRSRDPFPLGPSITELLYDRWKQDTRQYYLEENETPLPALRRIDPNKYIAALAKKYGPYVLTYYKRQSN